ncbi:BamA/TamA family outer membrane protein [uncultured Cytophaga sp.]|uniref:BamA/TamA family outer membrane protein n=1 Tax=uncultured Cytophaga sp. TaxID=160238 RepID=UPI002610FCF9|nr:BamA/TamA family outer membrane protein [uncultured Cytophaga sp.]
MHSILKHIILIGILFICPLAHYAQTQDSQTEEYIIIDSIHIVGNKKTKEHILLRELDFNVGDTIVIEKLDARILLTQNRLFNTSLFLETNTYIEGKDSIHKTLHVTVKERFYTYVIPIIGLADRNFNEWWVQRNHNLSRLELGMSFLQKNMRGRNESLKVKTEFGFTKKIECTYTIPYLTTSRKLGLIYYVGYILNKQVAYNTIRNKLFYIEDNSFIRERFSSGLTFTYRGKFYIEHQLGVTYFNNHIGDTIVTLNPTYFSNAHTKQEYISLKYAFIRDHRDIRYYALKGSYIRFDVEQMGLGINKDIFLTSLKGEISIFQPFKKKFYLATTLKGKYSSPINQPYFNQRGLGYDKEAISGYEQYVVDGQKYLLSKVNFKYKLFDWNVNLNNFPEKRFAKIPLMVYFKTYVDMGYVWDNRSSVYALGNIHYANTYLPGGGFGLDFVTYYDFVIRVEYSVNRDMQSGVFINFKATI